MLRYTLSIIIFALLLACGASQTGTEKAPEQVVQNDDSILALRKALRADEKTKLLKEVFALKAKENGLNACVLVAQQGQILYENCYGFSDLKKKIPLTLGSAFQLASVSKTLTAGAILLLKDQGKLQLSDNVQKYFPDFPYPGVTIKLLLCHRSGLSNYIYFGEPYCDANNCYNGKTFDNNAVLEIMKTQKPAPYAAPDKKFEYCNTNYALLASIVEKVSGQNFADFMEENIFKPLGMDSTWVHRPGKDKLHRNLTWGHNGLGKAEEDCYSDDVVGDKGVYATVEDMLKWDQALYSEKLLKKATLEEAFTGYSNEHKGKRNYGYGWRLIDDGVHPKIIYHNGWWHGYTTLFYRRPSDRTTVIILSNKFSHATYHIEDVLAVLGNAGAAPDPGE
jgi:CubicO group peptidase (beta-lactamase class C family)